MKIVLWTLGCTCMLWSLSCSSPVPGRISQLQDSLQVLRSSASMQPDEERRLNLELAGEYLTAAEGDSSKTSGPQLKYKAAEILSNYPQRVDEALWVFEELEEEHPDHPLGADALFQQGWLLANVIGDTAQAQVRFGTFLQRYPDHVLAPSVPVELAQLGMSPAEAQAFARQALAPPVDSTSLDSIGTEE